MPYFHFRMFASIGHSRQLNMLKNLQNLKYYSPDKFFLIAGPCAIESEEMTFKIAEILSKISDKFETPLIFKASYKKANRSRLDSFTGIGDAKALAILDKVRTEFKLPVTTDIHTESEASLAAHSVDILQIPAFLCRQTELLVAAARTQKMVNIKKGQFMSPSSMQFAIDKVKDAGNGNIMLTERGTTFGYQDLVVDFRGIKEMKSFDVPVILDCTHSLQKPNQMSGVTGGNPDMIETLAKAAIAVGTDGLFIETHPNPGEAKSDGANMLPIHLLEALVEKLIPIRKAIV